MRVLQLIDSLHTGGAERMAVNIANVLSTSEEIDKSYLCVTRKEGLLKEGIEKNVSYFFLEKKRTIDFTAFFKLNKFIRQESISVIHSHSTSFFLATLIKIFNKNVTLIWHDHYGNSEFLKQRKSNVLKFCSYYFDHVFSVNSKLEAWAKSYLKINNVSCLANFVIKGNLNKKTELLGLPKKRVIHLANLRPQKDHLILIDAFSEVIKNYPDWTLHCVGKDFNDNYSESIKEKIKLLNMEKSIFLYGSLSDTTHVLSQCDIGVLSSKSEGLPLSLLEYGMAKLAVVATNVGDCNRVINNIKEGTLIEPEEVTAFSNAILKYIKDPREREDVGMNLYERIIKDFDAKKVLNKLVNNYKN